MGVKLVACKECDHQISKRAKACPNCGGKGPAKKNAFLDVILGLFCVYVLAMYVMIDPDAYDFARKLMRVDEKQWVIKDSTIGCSDPISIQAMKNAVIYKDIPTYLPVILEGVFNGTCVQFKQGDKVIISESEGALIRIHRETDSNEFWTVKD